MKLPLAAESAAARPSLSNDACARRSSSGKPPWRTSPSTPLRNCPPPRSETSRPCAGSTPARRVRHFVGPGRRRKETHVAQALGHQAVRQGANAPFTQTSSILAELAGGHADRTWDNRMPELIRPDLLILDDFAMRQMTAPQADDLYELVSEPHGRSLIITATGHPATGIPSSPTRSSPSRCWTD
ncbi:ATP-binding protein [Streptomyces sp. NPDC005760]|uniref:ATP-binding protein n=1 Tax=Streptomyces sp. NPDC005760 TaxID=3156718 RepID=UPI0033FA0BD8